MDSLRQVLQEINQRLSRIEDRMLGSRRTHRDVVLTVLKRAKDPLSTLEIANKAELDPAPVRVALYGNRDMFVGVRRGAKTYWTLAATAVPEHETPRIIEKEAAVLA